MKLRLGFSSCPNDTFIFDAMVHHRIDTEGLEFDPVIEDVEALNQKAMKGELDVTKLSYFAFAHLISSYLLLDAGSALGHGCGPLLIARTAIPKDQLPACRVAIPGYLTTANFLLSLAFPEIKQKQEMLFSAIETSVLEGATDAGLIIHENRFTYEEKGLVKIIDLGAFWEELTALPIPLGGIVVRSELPEDIQNKINRVMKRSVQYAFDHPEASEKYVREHAQEMEYSVMQQHIELYVNAYTLDLGTIGKQAVQRLFDVAVEKQIINNFHSKIFLNYENV